MRLLAIDTATERCSAAAWADGELDVRESLQPRAHARLILAMVRDLLDGADWRLQDLDALVFGRGPGSFTGVRIAAGVAQGLALGGGLGVMGISDLLAVASVVARREGAERVLVAQDARMDELYLGGWGFGTEAPDALVPEQLVAPGALQELPEGEWWLAGSGLGFPNNPVVHRCLGARRPAGQVPDGLPHASELAHLAAAALARGERPMDPAQAQPVYLRDEVAWKRA